MEHVKLDLMKTESSSSIQQNRDFQITDNSSFEYNKDNDIFDIIPNKTKQKKKPIHCKHFKWTKREDNKLRQLVMQFGQFNWRFIAKQMEKRNSRQCRERWQNYLNPFLNISHWTKEEDELILKKREELGPKWMNIKNFFINRTDAMIKNRYRNLMKIRKKNEDNKYNEIICNNNINQLKNLLEQEQENYFSNENDDDFYFENDDLLV